ncbi:MAG: Nif3-like dinuclear metal center hexameric protein, partial [Pseudomonadota bacterium]
QAQPHIGQAGILESVDEEQIQVDVLEADMKAVLSALRESHPYEEIGYEIYEMLNNSQLFKI